MNEITGGSKSLKILVTGGYGFIGSFMVEKLHQEGHQLFIIDNLSSGDIRNINCKHRFYQLNVEDPECEEIFKNNRFDLIIHLAARSSYDTQRVNPQAEISANVLGLVNMLDFAVKYAVKKFVFASTAEIYGNNPKLPLREEYEAGPISFYGIGKLTGELYCRRWSEVYGLNMLIFRLASVYGPRQKWIGGEAGFISRMVRGVDMDFNGAAANTRDYIYIDDVVEAIYQAIKSDTSGILNLSLNQETSFLQLMKLIREKAPAAGDISFIKKQETISRSCLDNAKAKMELNWTPRYSLEAGIAETVDWLSKTQVDPENEITAGAKKIKKWSSIIRLPYIENGIAFVITFILTEMTKYNSDYTMLDVKLIYIIMMGIMYGMVQSLIAVLLSIGLFIFTSLSTGRDIISLINDPINIVQIILYSMVGLYIGYTTERRNREILVKNRRLQELETKFTFVSEINEDARQVKDELQNQILNFEDSYGKIFNMTRELDSLEPENIYHASVLLVENVMKSDSVSIYFVNQTATYLRLIAKSKKLEVVKSLIIKERSEIQEVLMTRDLVVNKSLHVGVPMLLAPIMDGDRVVAIVGLNYIQFENLTLYYQNLFKVVIGLISSSLTKAFRYKEATGHKGSALGIPILNREDFRRMVTLKREAKSRTGIDYSILRVHDLDMHNAVQLHQLVESVREVDYIGYSGDGISVLLSNTNHMEAELTVARLKEQKISAAVVPNESGKG
jgi:UDP-glucuronate decarboxylase